MSVHHPECNVWCSERGHWLLSSGPAGEPFSHQDPSFARGGIVAVPQDGSDEVSLILDRCHYFPPVAVLLTWREVLPETDAMIGGMRLFCPRCLADGHVCEVQDGPPEPPEPVPALAPVPGRGRM